MVSCSLALRHCNPDLAPAPPACYWTWDNSSSTQPGNQSRLSERLCLWSRSPPRYLISPSKDEVWDPELGAGMNLGWKQHQHLSWQSNGSIPFVLLFFGQIISPSTTWWTVVSPRHEHLKPHCLHLNLNSRLSVAHLRNILTRCFGQLFHVSRRLCYEKHWNLLVYGSNVKWVELGGLRWQISTPKPA